MCIGVNNKCGCTWVNSQGTTLSAFSKLVAPAPVTRIRYLDRVALEIKKQQNGVLRGFRFTATKDSKVGLEGTIVNSTGLDWTESKKQTVQWFGAPMRYLTNLDRVAFECPPETVPTKIYFRRAGCNEQDVMSLRDKKSMTEKDFFANLHSDRRSSPPCLASAQNFNEGLSMVTECRPFAPLIDSNWKWVDAGIGAPVSAITDLSRVGGVCEPGSVMTGLYFKRWACNADLWWNQLVSRDSVLGRCAANATGVAGRPPTEGLIVRVKCTRFSEANYQECNRNTPCNANADCIIHPTYGTRCHCKAGYTGDGYTCTAINRCEDGTHNCAPSPPGYCSYKGPGTYTCGCDPGYTKDAQNHCIRNTKPSNIALPVIPGFAATCVIEHPEISGRFLLEATMNVQKQPQGIKISHNLKGPLQQKVSTWDLREHLVQGTRSECVASGRIFKSPLADGSVSEVGSLTAKWGPIRVDQEAIYDPELKLWGDYSIVGRSIVLKDTADDELACCTIFLSNGTYTPVQPTYVASGVSASCNFDDGRSVYFTGLSERMGNGPSVFGGHSVGSDVQVNPSTEVRISTNFNAGASLEDWYFGTNNNDLKPSPEVGTCLGTRVLGGVGKLGSNKILVFKKSGVRPFKAIRVRFTYYAFNSWDGEQAYLSFDDEKRGKEYKIWTIKPHSNDANFRTGYNAADCNGVPKFANYTVDKTYYFQDTLTDVYLEFGSNLNEHPSNEAWGLTAFSVWLAPVDGYEQIYVNDFAGNFARQDFRVGPADGSRWVLPPVQACPASPTYYMLGGINFINGTNVLEYNKRPEPATTFQKIGVSFNFYFQGTWPANQGMYMDILNSAGLWVNVWYAPTITGTALANCQNTAVRMVSVGPVYAALPQTMSVVSLRWRKGGSAGSFGISKFKVQILPTPQLVVVRKTDFAPSVTDRLIGWDQSPTGLDGSWSTPQIGECNWKGQGQHRELSTDYIMGGASTMGAGWKLRFRAAVPEHKRAIIHFKFWFWRSWDGERAIMTHRHPSPDGASMVTTELWRRRFNYQWSSGLLCPGHTWRDATQNAWVTYNMPKLVKPITSVHFEWTTTLDQAGPDEAFGIGDFGFWVYPLEESVVLNIVPVPDFREFSLTSRSGQNLGAPPVATCEGEKVLGTTIAWDRLINFSTITTRPFDRAVISFNYWFLDSWDGEFARMDVIHNNRAYTSYLDSNRGPYNAMAEVPVSCGNPSLPFASIDSRRRVSVPIVLDSATTNLNLQWQSNLDQPATDEAWGISDVSIDIFPVIPTSVVVDQLGSSNTKSGLTVLEPSGTAIPFTYSTCGNGLFLWPKVNPGVTGNRFLALGRRLRLNLLHNQEFTSIRVFFHAHFANSWDREYAWLDFNSDKVLAPTGKPEVLRLWKNEREYEGLSSGRAPWSANLCSSDTNRWNDASMMYAVESQRLQTPTRRVQLDWGCDVDEDVVDNEGFALVGWKVVAVHPPRAPQLVAELSFSNNNIEQLLANWKVVSGAFASIPDFKTAAGTQPAVSECKGPRGGSHFLLGAGLLSTNKHLVYSNNFAGKSFTKAYISFRYFFLRSWDGEVGRVYVNGNKVWETSSIHSKHYPDWKCPIQGATSPTYGDTFSDATIVFTSPKPISEITVVFTSTLDQINHLDESFAISYFKVELETPDYSYKLQESCTSNRALRTDDGYAYQVTKEEKPVKPGDPAVITTTSWAQGELTNKHGNFETFNYRDFDLPLSGPTSILQKRIGLYAKPTDTRPVKCCTVLLTPNSQKPVAEVRKVAKKTAACHINRPNVVEGEIAVVAPGTKTFGSKVEINLRFFGEQQKVSHRVYISPRGLAPTDVRNNVCPASIYNTPTWIGPHAVSAAVPARPGQVVFPGSPDGTIIEGDITSKFVKIPGTAANAYIFHDGQIALTGAHSVVGRTVVVTDGGNTPLACCTLGLGLVGSEKDPYVTGAISRKIAVDYLDFDPVPDKGARPEANIPQPPSPPGTPPAPPSIGDDNGILPSEAQHVIPGSGRKDLNGTDGGWLHFGEDDGLNGGEIAGIVIGSIFGAVLLAAGAMFALGGGVGGSDTGDYVAL